MSPKADDVYMYTVFKSANVLSAAAMASLCNDLWCGYRLLAVVLVDNVVFLGSTHILSILPSPRTAPMARKCAAERTRPRVFEWRRRRQRQRHAWWRWWWLFIPVLAFIPLVPLRGICPLDRRCRCWVVVTYLPSWSAQPTNEQNVSI